MRPPSTLRRRGALQRPRSPNKSPWPSCPRHCHKAAVDELPTRAEQVAVDELPAATFVAGEADPLTAQPAELADASGDDVSAAAVDVESEAEGNLELDSNRPGRAPFRLAPELVGATRAETATS